MKRALFFWLCLFLAGCVNLSPDYAVPDLGQPLPPAFKEGWKTADPADERERGPWWRAFADPDLNRLMDYLEAGNQDIAQAAANLRSARTRIMAARAAFFPGVSLPASYTRSGREGGPITSSASAGISAQWEISFWNSLPALEAARADAQAAAADFATLRLSAQAELAQSYFQLRALDEQEALYESTLRAYARALRLTRNQYRGGIITPADVAQAEARLAGAESELLAVRRDRATLEHGIALLCGQVPAAFSLAHGRLSAALPAIPAVLPAALLERRPDIAAAERRVAAANQRIGIARAAWFPTLSLSGSRSAEAAGWALSPLTVWSLGPGAALSLFQGGRRLADNEAARADYEASVAAYRQTVLTAFAEVEDLLSALDLLAGQAKAERRAAEAARRALNLALSQYEGGMTTYLQVVSAQATLLLNERNVILLEGRRLASAVGLIKALGGGWEKESRP
ncbi:MAG: efflux transporter outer membrane subunit [Desulfovibrio sp.]|jgi:NodT family efflux transporter outer membrane factor (OMF) lipoprotein|nr:efflux transporter outer membrane subunit [Desulfovibrio sp.]